VTVFDSMLLQKAIAPSRVTLTICDPAPPEGRARSNRPEAGSDTTRSVPVPSHSTYRRPVPSNATSCGRRLSPQAILPMRRRPGTSTTETLLPPGPLCSARATPKLARYARRRSALKVNSCGKGSTGTRSSSVPEAKS
jgi:hypothetical protein